MKFRIPRLVIAAFALTAPLAKAGSVPTLADVLFALRAASHLTPDDAGALSRADANDDGRITVSDAVLLLKEMLFPAAPDLSQSTWTAFDQGPASPVYCLLWDDSAKTVWAAVPGQNLFKSENDGATWETSAAKEPFVFWIFRHAAKSNVLIAGTFDGFLRSEDHGASWVPIAQAADGEPIRTIDVIASDPSRPDALYAAGDDLLKSDDGGVSWRYLNLDLMPSEDIHAFAVDPWNPDHAILGTRYGRVFVSSDGGETWSEAGGDLSARRIRIFDIAPDPFVKNRWYLGSCAGGFWRSDDGGANWRQFGGAEMPPNVNALLLDPDQPGHLFAGTSGGPVYSDDYGESWSPLGAGLEGREVLSMIYGGAPRALFAGTWTAETGVYRLP